MKNQGKLFEEDFKASIKEAYYLRLHDSANAFDVNDDKSKNGKSKLRFSLKSPYDAIVCRNGQMHCFELKSIGTSSASFMGRSPRIKIRQVKELLRAETEGGARSYLVINFRKYGETYAIRPADFLNWANSITKKSINIDDARKLGIFVPSSKKRTRYRYDINSLYV